MRIAAAKALGWTNSMLFPGGRTGELNGAYMCRIIRQARIQSPGMPPFFSPALVWNTCLTQSPNTIFLLTDYRLYSCSVNSARHTQLPLCPPPTRFFFAPEKEKGQARGGVEGGGLIEGEGRRLLCAKTFPWVHCFGCRCKALVGFSLGVCCLFSEGETRAKASGWWRTGTQRMWNSDFILPEVARGYTAACHPECKYGFSLRFTQITCSQCLKSCLNNRAANYDFSANCVRL